MNNFKVGDKVVRINEGNGARGARVGQKATVIKVENNIVTVSYHGCLDLYGKGSGEGWFLENTGKWEVQQSDTSRVLAILIASGKITNADVAAAHTLATQAKE